MADLLPVRLTLVSASPRRRELLQRLGIPFDVCPTDVPELTTAPDGSTLAIENARRKVERSFYAEDRSRILLGADTVVALDGVYYGKPDDAASAQEMLSALSDHVHDVITGVCLSGPSAIPTDPFLRISSAATSRVRFRPLSQDDVQSYIDTGEWEGKAGAYAIQGAGGTLVANLEGDFDNVVGLPVSLIHDLLSSHFSHCRFL